MKSDSEALTETQTASPTETPRGEDRARRSSTAEVDDPPATQVCSPTRYRILGEHGRGARGCVSRAHDRALGRDIAIKELISRGEVDEVRFLREALITARLEHPGIVPVYEAGRWPDGTPFYAMKLVAGRPLSEILAERKTVDERIPLLHHVIAVADAIAYAHGRNIIHRDLKPANIIVGEFGETVVIDWGLAKDITVPEAPAAAHGPPAVAQDDGLTATGSVMGTPAYMPPEQRRGALVDQRADVFAIGAMLWELCALQRTPPAGPAQRRRILRRAGIDRDLIAIIDKAVDEDPAYRYPDAGALASDLKAFKAGARISARHYSLLATLVHWTVRHRALAISVAAAVILGIAGGIHDVHNIAAERDRADQERDRARLSEAAALIGRDPSRARSLLASLPMRSPQYALLMSRARQRAAAHVVSGLTGAAGLFRAPGAAELALLTIDGELYGVDPLTGARRLIDRDVTRAVTYHAGDWLYGRLPFDTRILGVASPSVRDALDTHGLTGISSLVSLRDSVHALDVQNDLYRLSRDAPALVRRGVHRIAGDGSSLLICAQDGTLELVRDGAVVLHRRCPRTVSPGAMAVRGDDYAALTDTGTLIASRGHRVLELPTTIAGEYELALSSAGVIAVADYGEPGRAWFVRPGASTIEPAPAHPGPISVAAEGRYAAWGFHDGTVIAVDATTGASWEFQGHPDPVSYIVIDGDRATLTSISGRELRIWNLTSPPATSIGRIPHRALEIQSSPDGTQLALACEQGGVWVWSRRTGALVRIHEHAGHAIGVQWIGGRVCSGGWDGKVICTTPDGATTRTFEPRAGRVTRMTGAPDASFLVLATDDGRIWRLDSELHPLYAQEAIYQLAISSDGKRLASCGLDGSLVAFDLTDNRLMSRVIAHRPGALSVAWWSDAILTSGVDGAVRRWSLTGEGLQPRGQVQDAAPARFVKAIADGWVHGIDGGTLSIHRAGSASVRLDLARPIQRVKVSPDLRYFAAGMDSELVVIDLRTDRLATLAIESSDFNLAFLDGSSLAVGSTASVQIVRLDDLDYERF